MYLLLLNRLLTDADKGSLHHLIIGEYSKNEFNSINYWELK